MRACGSLFIINNDIQNLLTWNFMSMPECSLPFSCDVDPTEAAEMFFMWEILDEA